MSIDVFNAYIEGYGEHMFDYQLLAAHVGYWAGYFQSKRPKPLEVVLNKLIKAHKNPQQKHTDEVDVESFLKQQEEFNRRLIQGGMLNAK
nr:MAG TPA: hypothetical protein [Caudoviricetes sp.]